MREVLIMAKYEIKITIESDNDYSNSNQIEDLVNEITLMIANYNCFYRTREIQVRKSQLTKRKREEITKGE